MPGARDGQLRIRRGLDSPPWALQMFDDELGLWLTLAQANEEDEAMAQGIPVLRGPYVVDFTDIPHDGDTKTLWTPQVGDMLIALAVRKGSIVHGATAGGEFSAAGLNIGTAAAPDSISADIQFYDRGGDDALSGLPQVFTSTSPVQVSYTAMGEGDMTAGHMELFALVARPVAP